MNVASEHPPFPMWIGRYELLLPIGAGGSATVYLGRTHVVADVYREVAVKLLRAEVRSAPEELLGLLEEAKLAGSLRHPNVVAVTEAGEGDHGAHLILDYVEGDSLAGLISRARRSGERIPDAIGLRILLDALSGLHAAHELCDARGRHLALVHRDFSPQNLLVGTDGIARLTDFGIAKALDRLGVTRTGVVKGKLGYMSPEQARGQRLDRRSDVWAAAVMCWELCVGRRLFQARDAVAVLESIAGSDPIARLGSERPDLPPALDEVVARGLERELDRRFASAEDFKRALAAAWGIEPADQLEVAAYVQRIAAGVLSDRRRQAARVIAERHASQAPVGQSQLRPRRVWIAALAALLVVLGSSAAIGLQAHEPVAALRTALPGAMARVVEARALAVVPLAPSAGTAAATTASAVLEPADVGRTPKKRARQSQRAQLPRTARPSGVADISLEPPPYQ